MRKSGRSEALLESNAYIYGIISDICEWFGRRSLDRALPGVRRLSRLEGTKGLHHGLLVISENYEDFMKYYGSKNEAARRRVLIKIYNFLSDSDLRREVTCWISR